MALVAILLFHFAAVLLNVLPPQGNTSWGMVIVGGTTLLNSPSLSDNVSWSVLGSVDAVAASSVLVSLGDIFDATTVSSLSK